MRLPLIFIFSCLSMCFVSHALKVVIHNQTDLNFRQVEIKLSGLDNGNAVASHMFGDIKQKSFTEKEIPIPSDVQQDRYIVNFSCTDPDERAYAFRGNTSTTQNNSAPIRIYINLGSDSSDILFTDTNSFNNFAFNNVFTMITSNESNKAKELMGFSLNNEAIICMTEKNYKRSVLTNSYYKKNRASDAALKNNKKGNDNDHNAAIAAQK